MQFFLVWYDLNQILLNMDLLALSFFSFFLFYNFETHDAGMERK